MDKDSKSASARLQAQILIIGAGLAGCTAALGLANAGLEVILIYPNEELSGGNSDLAQGGIIYRALELDPQIEAKNLAKDILVAGHNYNNRKAVETLCHFGPSCIEKVLFEQAKIPFDTNSNGSLHLTREGGHGLARIIHCADYTGKAIMDGLCALVAKHPKIRCLSKRSAIDLLTMHHHVPSSQYRYNIDNHCLGAYVYDGNSGEVETILANWTIIASGGLGSLFLHSTNAPGSVGSGVTMAARAGVALANLEFMQFHPTALYLEHNERRALMTEALRGEGAKLLDSQQKPFMQKYDKRGDLAPRDIVSQAMVSEMLHSGAPCLFLDARSIEKDLKQRFPTVFNYCLQAGFDIRNEVIPVVPAAHYFCGGILSDSNGQTSLKGLYAIGESACTGVHGANRLASTSLLEALVWGVRSSESITKKSHKERDLPKKLWQAIPDWQDEGNDHHDDPALIAQDWNSIRYTMWNYVGVSRSQARLKRAFEDLRDLVRHIHDFYRRTRISRPLAELFHGSHAAYIITQAALRNTKSLGCHYRLD